MKDLIKITENEEGNKVIMASELHAFLEVKTPLRKWIKRMLAYGFDEGIDFIESCSKMSGFESEFVGRTNLSTLSRSKLTASDYQIVKIDFLLTLDTAKELAMLSKTDKGKQIRRYFIECEKSFKQVLIDQAAKEKALVQACREHIAQVEAWHKSYADSVAAELNRLDPGQKNRSLQFKTYEKNY